MYLGLLCICLRHYLFVGQLMSSHHFDQMSQRSQVSWLGHNVLWSCEDLIFSVIQTSVKTHY